MPQKCKLSVNVNKIATLRNSRGGSVPNLLQCAKDIVAFGAEGLTVHPRPDGRHIRRQDVYDLKELLNKINKRKKQKIEFNIEGYPSADFLKLLAEIHPDQATLVPDPPEALTSNAGWKVAKNEAFLAPVLKELRKNKIRSSLFIDVFAWDKSEQDALVRLAPDRVELYTEKFATDYPSKDRRATTEQYKKTAQLMEQARIAVNAGHDLSLKNVRHLIQNVPQIIECSIGHALISESLYLGFKKTIQSYLKEMKR